MTLLFAENAIRIANLALNVASLVALVGIAAIYLRNRKETKP